jgi:predicted dehydrogenase
MKRRHFIQNTGAALAGSMLVPPLSFAQPQNKMRVAMVGTGIRGITFWGKALLNAHSQNVEFVGLCDINPGRLAYAQKEIAPKCPTFADFEKMMKTVKPDTVIVTTVDSLHHEYIIKAMEMGANVITEKPMTIDEISCEQVIQAEKRTGKKVLVGLNYRYGSIFSGIKQQLASGRIGRITSVDFHWYLNTYHGADYFRRWHRLKEKGGTLLVHKSSHHFDLVNWFLDSDPSVVFAMGSLDFYGKNGPFRHTHCRTCPHQSACKYHMDITKRKDLMDIYVANEQYDGYLRDGCVFKEDINIYDKMGVQVQYANGAILNYSLTTYSPYEGWRIAFNGTEGRLEASEGIPWEAKTYDQESLHQKEMEQNAKEEHKDYDRIYYTPNFGKTEIIQVERKKGGHGGGDARLLEALFSGKKVNDPLGHAATVRDGAMSILVGVAARKSIETGQPIQLQSLTSYPILAKRP